MFKVGDRVRRTETGEEGTVTYGPFGIDRLFTVRWDEGGLGDHRVEELERLR